MIYTSPYPSLNARFAPMAQTVPQLVRHVAERSPDHPAIVDASSQAVVTYATLAGQIDRVAADLAGRGFAPGDVLALRAPNTPAWAAVALGAMAAGGAVTGVSPLATESEAAAQLASAQLADGGAHLRGPPGPRDPPHALRKDPASHAGRGRPRRARGRQVLTAARRFSARAATRNRRLVWNVPIAVPGQLPGRARPLQGGDGATHPHLAPPAGRRGRHRGPHRVLGSGVV
jgi:non-ribosomal peptide synthetase component F